MELIRERRAVSALAERQHDLPDVAALVDVAVRRRTLRDGECAVDARADAPGASMVEERLDLRPDDLLRGPQAPQVDSRDHAIVVHQGERSETGPAQRLPHDLEQVAARAHGQLGRAEANQAPHRCFFNDTATPEIYTHGIE